ncbi:hypothetical protein BU17DRAFT_76728 [Hysterangium stoloniferum]|nr:hypothetical protein BU17DRAFT_76728 [Hysterangium stoloniferum]
MTENDIGTMDSIDGPDFMDGQLSDEELEIPIHMVPPNPDDANTLPSQGHPSYPYGNPTNPNHPAALPHISGGLGRALHEDMGYAGGTLNAALRWKDLGLEMLLLVNEEKEAERAAVARRVANGATHRNHPAVLLPEDQTNDDDEDEEDGEEEEEGEDYDDDESGLSHESFESGIALQPIRIEDYN